ncbi:MAG: hypothetical protein GZ088_03595 [Acidipila sp.]|nr:hypothetical protein [Acidipila sp.]
MNMRSFFSRLLQPPIPSRTRVVALVALVLLLALVWSSPASHKRLDDAAANVEIHDAARQGDLEKIQSLLKTNPDLVFSEDDQGSSPLHMAAWRGQKDVAELLLASGADVNAKDNFNITPLQTAAMFDHKDVAQLLLAHKADVNAKNNKGTTSLHYAAISGYKDVVELLLASKADVNARRIDGDTPLIWAAMTGSKDVAELLLANGADVNANGRNARTPLQVAAVAGHKDVVELLRRHNGHEPLCVTIDQVDCFRAPRPPSTILVPQADLGRAGAHMEP